MKKNIIILIVIILAAVAFRYGMSVYDGIKQNKMMKNKKPPAVTVAAIQTHDIIRSFEAPGRVVSKYQVNVMARIAGYLQKSYFKEGDFVKAGQTLFQIEPAEFSNAANVAKADVENTRAQLVYAEKQLARAKELVAKDYIAKSQYDNLLAQRDSLKAQLASAQARYNDSNRSLGYTHVKAPVDGRIGIITVTLGNYVTPSSGSLTTINSTNPIYVTFPLDSADFNSLSLADGSNNINRKTEIYFSNGEKYPLNGTQDFHDNKIDQSTGTVTMRATFENPNNQLLHGEFVTVKLYSNKPVKTPVVPQTAVLENQAGKYVYLIDKDNLPQLVYVKIGEQDGTNWIVNEGLKAGDKVVVDGLQKVIPGQPVTINMQDENDAKETAQPVKEQTEENKK